MAEVSKEPASQEGVNRMRDPRDLYSFESTEVLQAVPRGELVLVHALPGLMDAGSASRIASTYLRESLRHVRLVTFDADELLDYRAARLQARFDGVTCSSIEVPELALWLVYDESDRPFLLLDGPEPDLQWNRLAQAVIDLVEFFEVERIVGIAAVPMPVPHTRPIGLIAHATHSSLLCPEECALSPATAGASMFGMPGAGEGGEHPSQGGDAEQREIVVPSSFATFLEYQMGRAQLPALGYTAQVPHYLARMNFPAGALALLRRLSDATGLDLPLMELGDLAEAASSALEITLLGNEEVRHVVETFEEQYDRMRAKGGVPLAASVDLPTADEIAERFEQFLADHDAHRGGEESAS